MMNVETDLALRTGAVNVFAMLLVSAAYGDEMRVRNGLVGVVDTPSAFHQSDAQTAVSLDFDDDVRTVSLAFQALPWIETSLSFSTFDDVGGGISEDNTALNLKVRLREESHYLPAISLGVDDLFSNSLESAEYIVASKGIGSQIRASLGLGWGRLGGYDTAGGVFADRPMPGAPRRAEFSHLFRGDPGLFGGFEWKTPLEGLTLAAEYSSASVYGTAAEPESRFNFAARYRVSDGLNVVAYNRNGTTTGLTLQFYTNAKSPPAAPNLGNVPPMTAPRPLEGRSVIEWADNDEASNRLRAATSEALMASAVRLERFAARGTVIRVGVSTDQHIPVPRMLGRTVRVLATLAPPSVTVFEITTYIGGLPSSTMSVPRDQVVALADRPRRGADSLDIVEFQGASPSEDAWDWSARPALGFSWNITPSLSLPLDEFGDINPELGVYADARYDFSRSVYVAGTLSYLLAGDKTIDPAPLTPTPRSDSGSYDRTKARLERLYGAYIGKVSKTVYGGLTFGLLESQYRGVSAETVWIPDNNNWAIGAELTYAQKRDYDEPFGALDFDAVTGFVSLYWDIGTEGLSAQIDVGRYLAGDWGTTLSLSRSFANGWDVTGYTTLTEDNRDEAMKIGARVSIPLSTLVPMDRRLRSVLRLGGNYGDAGARVALPDRLMRRVKDARNQRMKDRWSEFWN